MRMMMKTMTMTMTMTMLVFNDCGSNVPPAENGRTCSSGKDSREAKRAKEDQKLRNRKSTCSFRQRSGGKVVATLCSLNTFHLQTTA